MKPPAPMTENRICGLDVASTSAQAAVIDADHGDPITETELPATRAGEARLLELVPAGAIVVMESTGRYHQRWARCLTRAGRQVYVINALLSKRLASARNALRHYKSDRVDARELAHIGRLHRTELAHYRFQEDAARLRLRTLCAVRKGQRAALTNATRQAQHLLEVILPEAAWLNFAHNKSLSGLFLRIDSLARLRGLRRVTVQRYVHSYTDELIAQLQQPLSAVELFDALLPALQLQLRLVESLREHLQQLDAEVRAALRAMDHHRDAGLARTLPGFGVKIVPVLLANLPSGWREWGRKRQVARKLQAYFGLDPRLRESGKWRGKVRMTKRGNVMARTALFQAAICGMLYDPSLRAIYDRKRAEGKHHLVAVSHVMRLQLQRLVAVLYDHKPFVRQPLTASSTA